MQILVLGCFFIGHVLTAPTPTDCKSCVNAKKEWCVDDNQCSSKKCSVKISNVLNCPVYPAQGYEYDDDFARDVVLPATFACYAPKPEHCLKNALPTVTVQDSFYRKCSEVGPNQTCHAYTAYDSSKKAIILSFRGTTTPFQLLEEFAGVFEKKMPFFDQGHVWQYFYDGFYYLWNSGLETSIRNLKYKFPDYELWIFGHSLGASLASVAGSHIVYTGLYTPDKVKHITMGQPRTGDKNYASWHDQTFLYSYRIIHKHDVVPHIPPRGGIDEVWHHRFEIWYDNDMEKGKAYQLCPEDDGNYCSDKALDYSIDNHLYYFGKNAGTWPNEGCKHGAD